MTACVIVMGFDDSARLPDTALNTTNLGGGVVVATCNPCARTRRISIEASGSSASGFQAVALNSDELKPAETHVMTFPDSAAAQAWLDAQAPQLRRKRIYLIDPATP